VPHDDVLRGLRIDLATALRERDEAVRERDRQLGCRNLAQKDRNAYELQNEELRKALAAANARADAAERTSEKRLTELTKYYESHGKELARAEAAQEALAAARRECDLLRALLVEADASLATWHDDAPADECDDCVSLRPRIRVALTVSEAKT
jgi:hypothetical protein